MNQITTKATLDGTRSVIYNIVANIFPCDDLERDHIEATLSWIQSGASLFRIQRPDIPPKHLVSYFVLFDKDAKKVLLVNHKKAKLWLPSGGHVEIGEHPRDAAIRECFEELGVKAKFLKKDPIFLTVTMTVGLTPNHTDVTLWYVLKGCYQTLYQFDTEEFEVAQWFSFDEIPYERSDPHIGRFINKLEGYVS